MLFATKHGVVPVIVPIQETRQDFNDCMLEHLREGLLQKKIKTLSDVFNWFDYSESEIALLLQ